MANHEEVKHYEINIYMLWLYSSRRLDVIEFDYEEGLEYYFNCLADDMNYQIMIDSETGNIHWDREL